MKETINESMFHDGFRQADRMENFSREGRTLLFEYLEQLEEDTGEEIEFDVIALCCDYSEDSWKDIADNYSVDLSDCEDDDERKDVVREYLEENTSVVGETSDGFVYAVF